VTEVIVGKDESNFDWERHYGDIRGQLCKRTSYNTIGGVHQLGGTPFRKNFAGVGMTYDETRDAFIPPKTIYNGQVCNSWVLNENTCKYECPVPFPETYNLNLKKANGEPIKDTYSWNEETLAWDLDTTN
jgi:hypothetical protein